MFISFLYMFRATMCPSSGETNVFMRHLILAILHGWLSGMHTRQSSIQNNKYQMSQKYICFSWWWAHSRLKHEEKRNKHTKKNCAPSWLYLQVFIGLTRMPRRRMLHFVWVYIMFPTPIPWLYIQIEYWVAFFFFFFSFFCWKLGGGILIHFSFF